MKRVLIVLFLALALAGCQPTAQDMGISQSSTMSGDCVRLGFPLGGMLCRVTFDDHICYIYEDSYSGGSGIDCIEVAQ
jgi:hypothetical protein